MKKIIIACVMLLVSQSVYAGSLALVLTSGQMNGTVTANVTDADAARLIAFAQAVYPTRANPAYDPTCNPTPGPCAPSTLNNTAAQSVQAWAQGFFAGTVANVVNYEKTKAATNAAGAIVPPVIQ